jgi:regulation of enolase protein 1 (concanavalin A-like superfamily)
MERPIKSKSKNLNVKILESEDSSYFYIVEADTGYKFEKSSFRQEKNALELVPIYVEFLNLNIIKLKHLYKNTSDALELIILESVIRFRDPEFFKLKDRIEYEQQQKYLEVVKSKSESNKSYSKRHQSRAKNDLPVVEDTEQIKFAFLEKSSNDLQVNPELINPRPIKESKKQKVKSVVIANSNEITPNVSNTLPNEKTNLMEKRSRGRPRKEIA